VQLLIAVPGCGIACSLAFLLFSADGSTVRKAKAMAAFLSGEMKDTVQMNPAGAYGQDSFRL
jgi:hypothetical protein